jgi:hypothetical protein
MKHLLFKYSMNHPKTVILLIGLITVLFAVQIPKIHVDTDPENMLSPEEHVRLVHAEMKETFSLHDMLVLGIYSDKGVFNAETIPHVIAITDEIKELEGVLVDDIMAISEVDNITNTGGTIRVHPLVETIPTSWEEGMALKYNIDRNPILSNKLASLDGKLVGIYIPIEDNSLSFTLSEAIKTIAERHLGKEQYYIAGLPVAKDTFGVQMFRQMGISAPLSGLMIGLLFFFFFRRIKIVFAPMLVAIITITWTMGLLIGLGYTVHIMSSMIPIFLFPIAVLNSIHIISAFHERYQRYKHLKTTVQHTMEELFAPMLFTSLTTVVGFASLMLTPIPPVQVFGFFVSFGIATAWFLSMTFLPAYSMLLSKKTLKTFGVSEEGDDSFLAKMLPSIQRWSTNRARLILTSTVLLLVVSVIGISRIVVNDNPVNWFKTDHPLRQADTIMNSHMGGTYMSHLVFKGTEDSFKEPEVVAYMAQVQDLIKDQTAVGAVTSIVDVLKKIAYELKGDGTLPENYDEIAQFYFIYEMAGGDPDDLFTFITPEYDKAHLWVQMTEGDNILMRGVVEAVTAHMDTHPLPAGISTEWAGLNYINVVWQNKMVSGMVWSLLGSFATVLVMMIFLFRSLVWGLLSMVPLTVTITFIYALIGFTGKPYDMPVAVLSSLTLGLSIDFAIHFIKRAQYLHTKTGRFSDTMQLMFEEPAKAISRNMMVIAIGFVPLFFADLVPYVTVGIFFFTIMLFSGISTLIIMPALSTVLQNRLFPESTNPKTERTHTMQSTVQKAVPVFLGILLSASFLLVNTANAQTPEDIMKQSHLAYYYAGDDGVAQVEMTLTDKRGKERVRKFIMLRKDIEDGGEQRYYTYFQEPTDVRRMTFMVWKFQEKDDDRWIYIPALDLVKRIASNDRRSSFVGSDFTYEDVSGRHWSEDTHTLEREETLNDRKTYVIKSTPKDPKTADYAYRLSWIDAVSYLPLQEEYYDKKGEVQKVFQAEETTEVDGILTITKRKMTDTQKNHFTVVHFTDIDYNTGVEDNIFSERYLRTPPRKYIK